MENVTPVLNLPANMEVNLKSGNQNFPVRLPSGSGSGQGPQMMGELTPPEMLAGEPLGEGNTKGMVVLTSLADELIGDSGKNYADLVGQSITLTIRLPRGETRDFGTTIIGVENGRPYQSTELGLQERVEIKKWWYGRPETLQTDGYDMLIVRAADQNDVPTVLDTAEALGIKAQSLGAFLTIANRVLAIMQALLGSVGALALLVAALGVANTMMMAIYERTKEIGVLKALGARSREVRRMFTADAILLGFIGGVVGLILGTLLGRLADWIGHIYLANERCHRDWTHVDCACVAGNWIIDFRSLYRSRWWFLPCRPGCALGPGGSVETRIRSFLTRLNIQSVEIGCIGKAWRVLAC